MTATSTESTVTYQNPSPFKLQIPSWVIPGQVVDTRELVTKEGKVWAYSVRVMARGGMYDLTTRDEKVYQCAVTGQYVKCHGQFDMYNSQLKLNLLDIEPYPELSDKDRPEWTIPGTIEELRELKTIKEKKTWAYAIRINAMGGMYEVTTKSLGIYRQGAVGDDVTGIGSFDSYNGQLRLTIHELHQN